LESDAALTTIDAIRLHLEPLSSAYRTLYESLFDQRKAVYTEARDRIKGVPEWLLLSERLKDRPEELDALLAPLSQRADAVLDLPAGATVCRRTGATVAQLESDLAAVEAVSRSVLSRVFAEAAPEEKIERVSVARLYPSRITTSEEMEEVLKDLRDRIEKILAQGGSVVLE
jgi:hypothetical protein